jgi:hypothetical protein
VAALCHTGGVSGQVFVAHSPAGGEYARALVGQLGSAGLSVWPDQESGSPEFTATTAQQIEACAAVVVVITSAWGERMPQVVRHAQERSKPIVALLLAGDPPAWIGGLPLEDVRDGRMPGPGAVDWLRQTTGGAATAMVPVPVAGRRRGRVVAIVVVAVVVLLASLVGVTVIGLNRLANQASATPTGAPPTTGTTSPTRVEPVATTAPGSGARPGAPAEDAKAGDCLTGTTANELDAERLKVASCGSSNAEFQVVAVVKGKREPEAETACDPYIDTEYVFWSGTRGRTGTVLCLKETT